MFHRLLHREAIPGSAVGILRIHRAWTSPTLASATASTTRGSAPSCTNRYLDEKVYAEEMGFDGVMLNEHHSTPFCMGGVVNVEAAILARITKRVKIVLLGKRPSPSGTTPLWLAEELAEIDMISRGRLVTGWVRGHRPRERRPTTPRRLSTGSATRRPTISSSPPGPRTGPSAGRVNTNNYRYVNPWAKTYQQPHPQIWIPGVMSRKHRQVGRRAPLPLRHARHRPGAHQGFPTTTTRRSADENGYEAGTQHRSYLFKVPRR